VIKDCAIITGIILCGGKSKRLGRDKAFVKLEGRNIIERVVDNLAPVVNELIIVADEEKQSVYSSLESNLKVVTDKYRDKSALGGLYTGLHYSSYSYSIIVACDMPFLNINLLKYMVSIADGYDAVIPKIGNYIEPLHGIYSHDCMNNAEKLINENNLSIRGLISQINTRYVLKREIEMYDPELISFFNINNELDLQKAEQIIKKRNQFIGS
jgi:molybdopterin-guanine dinucleotide biosynthesis protein A